MRCNLLLVAHLVVVLSVHRAAAAGDSLSRWCADASMEDLMATSEACQKAELQGGGVECWAYVDAILQLCLDEATAAGQLLNQQHGSTDALGLLKRNRNKFLGKRGGGAWKRQGSRNNFLGKRETAGLLLRGVADAISGQQPAAEDKRSRNKFLGKRSEQNAAAGLRPMSVEKKSRNDFLGKRGDDDDELGELSRLMALDAEQKRSRNKFLGKRDGRSDFKRSRNKFLGKREAKAISTSEETHS